MSTVQDPPTIAANVSGDASPLPERVPFLISTDAFYRMLDAEVFADEDRVELWDGRIYEKMAKTQAHAVSGNKVNRTITRILQDGWFVGNENPVKLNDRRVPLPDLIVLRGIPDNYVDRRPLPTDVGLVVEFSLSSLKSDTGAKLQGYAEAGIPVYWIVNLVHNIIQTYETPVMAERRYANEAIYAVGQSVPLRLDGVLVDEIPALDLLPVRG